MALGKYAEGLQEIIWEHEETVRRELSCIAESDDANRR